MSSYAIQKEEATELSPSKEARQSIRYGEFSVTPPTFSLIDARNIFSLLLLTFILQLPGLFDLEFFRHTEADRTLIGWEMVTSGDYVVPHLMGSEILTKPPLFYWLVAGAMHLFGATSEWVARAPSVFISLLFVVSQYLFVRYAGASSRMSFLFSLCLTTSLLFLTLGNVAEIDMTFGFLCALTLYGSYFSIVRPRFLKTVLVYAVMGLAFLAKGPPVVFFFLWTHIVFYGAYRFILKSPRSDYRLSSTRFILWNLSGVAVFIGVVSVWIIPLALRVGWAELGYQLDQEVFQRVVQASNRGRGAFYYLRHLIVSVTPWSIPLIGAITLWIVRLRSPEKTKTLPQAESRQFFWFSVIVVAGALVMLSLSSGKSSRYFFPVNVFAVNFSVFAMLYLRGSPVEKWMMRFGIWFGFLCCAVLSVLPFIVDFEGVSLGNAVFCAVMLGIPLFFLGYACRKKNSLGAMIALALIMLGVRIGQGGVYVPFRNATRSVKHVSATIHQLVPVGEPIYTVEMFERWIMYYLKQEGRDVLRLTPALVKEMRDKSRKAYLLLNVDEELWRMEQLYHHDPELKIIREYEIRKDNLAIVEASYRAVSSLTPRRVFPTAPSPAYYLDAADWIP